MIIFVVQLGGVIKNTCLVVPNFSMTPIPKSIFLKLFFFQWCKASTNIHGYPNSVMYSAHCRQPGERPKPSRGGRKRVTGDREKRGGRDYS